MALALPFGNRLYNLHWTQSLKTALWISAIYFILSDLRQFPIKSILGAGVLLYFAFFVRGPNQLGMSLKISKKATRALAIIIAVTAVLNIAHIILFDAVKEYCAQNPEEGPFLEEIVEYEWSEYWIPDRDIYRALSEKDLKGTLMAMRSSFLIGEISAPIFETVIFFAILFPALWRKVGYGAAFWVTSTFFVSGHFTDMTFVWVPFIYIVSYGMAFFYSRTGSIYPSIAFHACVNLTLDLLFLSVNWGMPYTPSGG